MSSPLEDSGPCSGGSVPYDHVTPSRTWTTRLHFDSTPVNPAQRITKPSPNAPFGDSTVNEETSRDGEVITVAFPSSDGTPSSAWRETRASAYTTGSRSPAMRLASLRQLGATPLVDAARDADEQQRRFAAARALFAEYEDSTRLRLLVQEMVAMRDITRAEFAERLRLLLLSGSCASQRTPPSPSTIQNKGLEGKEIGLLGMASTEPVGMGAEGWNRKSPATATSTSVDGVVPGANDDDDAAAAREEASVDAQRALTAAVESELTPEQEEEVLRALVKKNAQLRAALEAEARKEAQLRQRLRQQEKELTPLRERAGAVEEEEKVKAVPPPSHSSSSSSSALPSQPLHTVNEAADPSVPPQPSQLSNANAATHAQAEEAELGSVTSVQTPETVSHARPRQEASPAQSQKEEVTEASANPIAAPAEPEPSSIGGVDSHASREEHHDTAAVPTPHDQASEASKDARGADQKDADNRGSAAPAHATANSRDSPEGRAKPDGSSHSGAVPSRGKQDSMPSTRQASRSARDEALAARIDRLLGRTSGQSTPREGKAHTAAPASAAASGARQLPTATLVETKTLPQPHATTATATVSEDEANRANRSADVAEELPSAHLSDEQTLSPCVDCTEWAADDEKKHPIPSGDDGDTKREAGKPPLRPPTPLRSTPAGRARLNSESMATVAHGLPPPPTSTGVEGGAGAEKDGVKLILVPDANGKANPAAFSPMGGVDPFTGTAEGAIRDVEDDLSLDVWGEIAALQRKVKQLEQRTTKLEEATALSVVEALMALKRSVKQLDTRTGVLEERVWGKAYDEAHDSV